MKRLSLVFFLLLILSSFELLAKSNKTEKWSFSYTALAVHFSPLNKVKDYIPNKIDENAVAVRLPLYFSANKEYTEGDKRYLFSASFFENCYIKPSFNLSFGKEIWRDKLPFHVFLNGNLYVREKAIVIVGNEIGFVKDILTEIDVGRYGINVFPALIFRKEITEYLTVDIAISGINLIQLSWNIP